MLHNSRFVSNGTLIEFTPDRRSSVISSSGGAYRTVAQKLRFLNTGLTITFNGKKYY